MTPDVNVLVAASRSDHPHHRVAWNWLDGALRSSSAGAPLTLFPMVLAGMLRIVTSSRIFVQATPTSHAVSFVDAMLERPGVRLQDSSGEWAGLRKLCIERSLSGNDIPDAWLAAAVIQASEHLVTFDRDFRKLLGRHQLTLLASA